MPIYEFECKACGEGFEELLAPLAVNPGCPVCGSPRTHRRLSAVSPPPRQPRGARVRSDESGRREREAARRERLAAMERKHAAGEIAPRRRGGSS